MPQLTWKSVTDNPEYKALPLEDQEGIKQWFIQEHIEPSAVYQKYADNPEVQDYIRDQVFNVAPDAAISNGQQAAGQQQPGLFSRLMRKSQQNIEGYMKSPILQQSKLAGLSAAGRGQQPAAQQTLPPQQQGQIQTTQYPDPSQPVQPTGEAIRKFIFPELYSQDRVREQNAVLSIGQRPTPEQAVQATAYEAAINKKLDIEELRRRAQRPGGGDLRIQAFAQGLLPIADKKTLPPGIEEAFPYSKMAGRLVGLAASYGATKGIEPAVAGSPDAWLQSHRFTNPDQAFRMMQKGAHRAASWGVKEGADQIARLIAGEKFSIKKTLGQPAKMATFGALLGTTHGIEETIPRIFAAAGAGGAWETSQKLIKNGKLKKSDLRDILLFAAMTGAIEAIGSHGLTEYYKSSGMADYLDKHELARIMRGQPHTPEAWAKAIRSQAELHGIPGSLRESWAIRQKLVSKFKRPAYELVIKTGIPGYETLPPEMQEAFLKTTTQLVTEAKLPINDALDIARELAFSPDLALSKDLVNILGQLIKQKQTEQFEAEHRKEVKQAGKMFKDVVKGDLPTQGSSIFQGAQITKMPTEETAQPPQPVPTPAPVPEQAVDVLIKPDKPIWKMSQKEYLSTSKLKVALKFGDKVEVGQPGEIHAAIYERVTSSNPEMENKVSGYGYVDRNGKYLSREEAGDIDALDIKEKMLKEHYSAVEKAFRDKKEIPLKAVQEYPYLRDKVESKSKPAQQLKASTGYEVVPIAESEIEIIDDMYEKVKKGVTRVDAHFVPIEGSKESAKIVQFVAVDPTVPEWADIPLAKREDILKVLQKIRRGEPLDLSNPKIKMIVRGIKRGLRQYRDIQKHSVQKVAPPSVKQLFESASKTPDVVAGKAAKEKAQKQTPVEKLLAPKASGEIDKFLARQKEVKPIKGQKAEASVKLPDEKVLSDKLVSPQKKAAVLSRHMKAMTDAVKKASPVSSTYDQDIEALYKIKYPHLKNYDLLEKIPEEFHDTINNEALLWREYVPFRETARENILVNDLIYEPIKQGSLESNKFAVNNFAEAKEIAKQAKLKKVDRRNVTLFREGKTDKLTTKEKIFDDWFDKRYEEIYALIEKHQELYDIAKKIGYVDKYSPRLREFIDSLEESIVKRAYGGHNIPKAFSDWFTKNRLGNMKDTELDALKIFERYVRAVGKYLYLSEPIKYARENVLESLPPAMRDVSEKYIFRMLSIPAPTDSALYSTFSKAGLNPDKAMRITRFLIDLSYMGLLGGRITPPLRNLLQTLNNTVPQLGYTWTGAGLQRLLLHGPTAFEEAKKAGILLEWGAELYKELGEDLTDMDQLRDALLYLFSKSDAVNRIIVWSGARIKFDHFYKGYMQKRGSIETFMRQTEADKLNKFVRYKIKRAMEQGKPEEARDIFSRELAAKTQYLYNKEDSPVITRHVAGKLALQMKSWPINYATLLKDSFENRNYAAFWRWVLMANMVGAAALGMTPKKRAWLLKTFGIRPITKAVKSNIMPPAIQPFNDAFWTAIDPDNKGNRAAKALNKFGDDAWKVYVPGGLAMKNAKKWIERDKGLDILREIQYKADRKRDEKKSELRKFLKSGDITSAARQLALQGKTPKQVIKYLSEYLSESNNHPMLHLFKTMTLEDKITGWNALKKDKSVWDNIPLEDKKTMIQMLRRSQKRRRN